MKEISIAEIIEATNGKLLSGNTNTLITSVCIDSRAVAEGCLFVPILGNKCDGHDFINKAFELGATVSFIDANHDANGFPGALIQVEDTVKAMQRLAGYYRKKFSIPVIGVTGSVGKTTTKEMISATLEQSMNVLKTEGNHNGQIGLPLTLFNLNDTHDAAVVEMGVSELGEMDRLAEIANPDIGVITNIGLSHIENFKSLETTRNEKIKIVKKAGGTLYLNGDSPLLSNADNITSEKIVYFGINGNYPYKCEDIFSNDCRTTFTLVTPEFREPITIPCPGIHNVYNALAAIAVASDMGIHLEDIKKGLKNFENVSMRQQISCVKDIVIIDDSYNASPDSVKSSVSVLKGLKNKGKDIVVIADMLELGEKSPDIHFETGRYIAIEGVDVLITIGENAKYLSSGASSISDSIKTMHFENNIDALKALKNIVVPNDKVLIKGSRGMHTDEIATGLKQSFEN